MAALSHCSYLSQPHVYKKQSVPREAEDWFLEPFIHSLLTVEYLLCVTCCSRYCGYPKKRKEKKKECFAFMEFNVSEKRLTKKK